MERQVSIKLVSHASVIISIGGVRILCDPWFEGKVFNESWSLLIPAQISERDLETIDYLWVSHEHPDHFHIPTLRALPESFKKRVPVLFKTDFTDKIPRAFKQLGFSEVVLMPHRRFLTLQNGVRAYCYHSRAMDSALLLQQGGVTVFNTNDAELTAFDCKLVVSDAGPADVVLDQYGIAGFSGKVDYDQHLWRLKKTKIENVLMHYQMTGAKVAIPFASFHFFSHRENHFLNSYLDSPRGVFERFAAARARCDVLYPGDTWTLGEKWDSEPALKRYDEVYARLRDRTLDETKPVELDRIRQAQGQLVAQLSTRFPTFLLKRLGRVVVRLIDYNNVVAFDLVHCAVDEVKDSNPPVTLAMSSQPLYFSLSNPFGFQTLGVSGRYSLLARDRDWRWFRVLFSLNNAGVYLRPRYLLRLSVIKYLWSRRKGLPEQIRDRLAMMFGETPRASVSPKTRNVSGF
jgi:UDP-MurNAc hydroxylase